MSYRSHRVDWPSGWYAEYVLDWCMWGVCLEASFGSESIYGHEYGIDIQFGPLYLDAGFCRSLSGVLPARGEP